MNDNSPLGPVSPPRFRISVGFRRVVLGDETFFLFLGKTSLTDLEAGRPEKSRPPVRRSVFVVGAKTAGSAIVESVSEQAAESSDTHRSDCL